MHDYDYVIVGGGPGGLTLATYLPGKVALVERHPVLGGCHRFDSETYKEFAEHGPRVYSGAYVNVKRVLRDVGLDWDDIFQPTAFSPELIDGKRWYQWLSAKEIAWLSLEYTIFALFDGQHGKHISMQTYCARKGFSESSARYVDLVCRFSDGAGASRYSLWEFVSGFDQHILPFYLPRKPNDAMFDHWRRHLEARGVDVFLGANVTRVAKGSVSLVSGEKKKKTLSAAKVVLCVPPHHADKLLAVSGLRDTKFRDFAKKTKYDPYWSVSFFGARVENAEGQRSTPWGVIAMQYPFGVVSAAASIFDAKSPVTGKTLKESGDEEAAREIRRQLGFHETVRYAYVKGPYNDQAFVAAAKKGYYKAELESGIAVVGTHNGKSSYNFTSMESAVQNALAYAGKPRRGVWHAGDYLRWGLFGLLVLAAYKTQEPEEVRGVLVTITEVMRQDDIL